MISISELYRTSFLYFLREVFRQLHPGDPPLRLLPYLKALCHSLQLTHEGEVKRLVVNVPPRHGKSITVAIAYCAWLLGRDPRLKILVGTYNEDLAKDHDQKVRMIMESAQYRAAFPTTVIDRKRTRQLHLHTTQGGFRMAVTTGGSATGFGGDYIILDDCMKAQDAGSEAERQRVEQWFRGTIGTRLNNKRDGVIISIQQRLHEHDLAAVMIEDGATHLNLPAIAQKRERIAIGQGRFYEREPGDLLDAEREDHPELERLRRELGPRNFTCQYLQDPTPPEGNLVRMEWFDRYDTQPARNQLLKVVQSWDTAASVEPGSAWSVCTTWGYHDRRWYLLEVYRARHEYHELQRVVLARWRAWKPDRVLIEDASTGNALISHFRAEGPFLPMRWNARGSKEERLIAQTGQMEARRIVLPREAPWLDEYCRELLAAPNGRYWDQVDSTTQFLEFALSRRGWIEEERDPVTGRKLHVRRPNRISR
jgi:predicted phage terminase large subunit-like protein